MNHSETTQPFRTPRARRGPQGSRSSTASITLSWISGNHDGARVPLPATELELTRELDASTSRTWTCSEDIGFDWVAALSSAHCSEVVLTARLGDNTTAKHLVLELAELLTFRLTATQPLIRVLFLPTLGSARAIRHHA